MSRRIPKLCRHRGSGQGYVTDPLTGKEVYLGAYGSAACRQAYERWVVAFLRRAQEAEGRPGAAGPSVAELWERYLDHAERYYRKHGETTSELRNLARAAAYCERMCPEIPAEDLTPTRLKEVRAAMVSDDLCRATVNHYVRRIRRCWRWGVAEGLVSAATLAGLEAVPDLPRGRGAARETDDVRPVPRGAVTATLPFLGVKYQVLVRLQLAAGMRPGEAVCMRPCDLDRTSEPWLYAPWTWKTEHHRGPPRHIWLGPAARDALLPLLEVASQPDAWLFRGYGGGHIGVGTYDLMVRRACRLAGVQPWRPNQLRHTRATEIRARHGVEAAQAVLGHEEVTTTQIYAERQDTLARRIAEEMRDG